MMTKSGEIGVLTAFEDGIITADIYKTVSLFSKPINSKKMGIYVLDGKVKQLKCRSFHIHSKMMIIPSEESLIAIKLLHHEDDK